MLLLSVLELAQQSADQVQEGLSNASMQQSVSLFEVMQKGGVIMIVLGVLSILALFIFVERMMVLTKAKSSGNDLMKRVKSEVHKGNLAHAIAISKKEETPMAKMIFTGCKQLERDVKRKIPPRESAKKIETVIENVGNIEVYKLENNVAILGSISGAAPMIGFFGTVIGMINAFIAISQEEGSVSPKLLSEGIYEAMVTTAGGLFVGIFAYLAYNYITRQVSNVVHHMQVVTLDFVDMLEG